MKQRVSIDEGMAKMTQAVILPTNQMMQSKTKNLISQQGVVYPKSSNRNSGILTENLEERMQKKGKDLLEKMMQKQERDRENSNNSKNTYVSGITTKISKVQVANKKQFQKSLTKGSKVTEKIKERRQILKNIQQKSACTQWVQKMRACALPYIQNNFVEIIMSISTIYCLYADDVRQYAFSKDADIVFYDITFTCFILFFLDCFFSCLIREKYFLSFQFYMDFVSTISLIFDIPWLSIIVFGTSLDGSQVSFLKAGRVTRVTARATRIVRFVKLVRIIRVGKLYKHAFENINRRVMKILQQDRENNNENEREDELKDKESPRQETLPDIERADRISLENRKLILEEEKDNVNNTRFNNGGVQITNNPQGVSSKQINSGRYLGINAQRKSQFAQGKSFLDTNPNDISIMPIRQPKKLLSQTVSPTSKIPVLSSYLPTQLPQFTQPQQSTQQIQQLQHINLQRLAQKQQQSQQNSQKRKLMKQRKKREQEEQQDFNSFEHTLFENYGGVQVSPLNAHLFSNQTITNFKNTSNKLAMNVNNKSSQLENILFTGHSPMLNKFMVSQDSIINSNSNNNNNNNLIGSTMAAGVDGILEMSLQHSTNNLTETQQRSLPMLNHTFQPDSARVNNINMNFVSGNNNNNNNNNNTNTNGQQQTSHYSSSYLSNNNMFNLNNNNNQPTQIPLNIPVIQPLTANSNPNNNTPTNSPHNNNISLIPLSKIRSNSFYSSSNANTPQLERINSTVFSAMAANHNNNNKDKEDEYPYHLNQEPIDSRQFDTERDNPDNKEEELSLLNKNKNQKHQNQPPTKTEDLFEQDTQQFVETKIGRHLSDLTTQRVILLIFSIILSFPFLTDTTWVSIDGSYDTGLLITDNYSLPDNSLQQQYPSYPWQLSFFINYHKDIQRYPLLWVEIDNHVIYASPLNNQLRDSEKAAFYYDPTNTMGTIVGLYSYKADSDLSSLLSIIQTSFIIVLLSMASYYFAKDFNEMLVDPIERMLIKIQLISSNPLEAARLAEDEAIAQAELKTKGLISYDSQFETHMLESTLIKIGALLALGFGEAGSEIIAKNMNKDGLVNPMIPGRKVLAIFGFVAIRNFADATEVLQENVMLFANEIAEIVHNVCDAFHGTANKNLGDCFLMVWKFKESDEIASLSQLKQSKCCLEDNNQQGNDVPLIEGLDASLKAEMLICQNFTDLALVGFLKTIANSYKLGQTKRFTKHTSLIQQYNPSFELKLGFGLHVGWGIEGSIGSQFKIDASYLSPNVNMASRLENATKQYGIQLLLSGAVYSLLSPTSQSYMRHVDRVTVKGSKQPMDLYTCDIETSLLVVNQPEIVQKTKEQNKKIFRFVYRKKKDKRFDKILSGNIQVHKLFSTDIDFIIMRQNYTKAFMDVFHEGMGYYIDGDWEEANQCFIDAQEILTKNIMDNQSEGEATTGGGKQQSQQQINLEDGPIKTLIGFMKSHDFQSPDTWKGFRELTVK